MSGSTTTPADGLARPGIGARILESHETGIIGALLIMMMSITLFAPDFASIDDLLNDSRNFSLVGLVVPGWAMVMITGGIDLSVGSVWGLAAVSSAGMMGAGFPVVVACFLALCIVGRSRSIPVGPAR